MTQVLPFGCAPLWWAKFSGWVLIRPHHTQSPASLHRIIGGNGSSSRVNGGASVIRELLRSKIKENMASEANKVIYSMVGVTKRHEKKVVLKDIYLSYFYG